MDYKYCTIKTPHGDFLAKVEFIPPHGWEPVFVLFNNNWVSIDFFEDTNEGVGYSCENYRTKQ